MCPLDVLKTHLQAVCQTVQAMPNFSAHTAIILEIFSKKKKKKRNILLTIISSLLKFFLLVFFFFKKEWHIYFSL